jgi:hypothetical protein
MTNAFSKPGDAMSDCPESNRVYRALPDFLWPIPYSILDSWVEKGFLPTTGAVELSSRYGVSKATALTMLYAKVLTPWSFAFSQSKWSTDYAMRGDGDQEKKNDKVQNMIDLYNAQSDKPKVAADVKMVDPCPVWRQFLVEHPIYCRRVVEFWQAEKTKSKKRYPYAGPKVTNTENKGSIAFNTFIQN